MIIEGSIAIKSAVKNAKRDIKAVYFDKAKRSKDFNYLYHLCQDAEINCQKLERAVIEKLAIGHSHGGVIAEVGNRHYESLDDIVDADTLFYIDGIEDPFNLGYVFRTLCAFGFESVILAKRDYTKMEATLLKSSAGAFDHLKIYQTDDIEKDMTLLHSKGYRSYALYRGQEAHDLFKSHFSSKSLFLIGGEKRGIASRILNTVDEYLYIPYAQDYKMALSTASCIDVLAGIVYERKNYR